MYAKRNTHAVMTALMVLLISGLSWAQDDADNTIEAQPLTKALTEFAEQTGLQLVYPSDLTSGVESKGATTDGTPEETLDQLLASTGLEYEYINDRTIAIEAQSTSNNGDSEPGKTQPASSQVLMAQNQTSAQQKQRSNSSETTNNEGDEGLAALEEIVVVGTHIRGSAPVGSPMIIFSRIDLERSGAATVQQFLETIPQNFGGGAAEDITSVTSDNSVNLGGGTGVNLRGLGTSSTLVLVNGRRLAQAGGITGSYVDISGLPFTAIERVEVLTDGASAIYGSDAIAGVVNFILRDDYDGAETRVRYGDSTQGGATDIQISQTFGKNWGTGNALFSFEYLDSDNLAYEEREYTASQDLRPFGGDDFRLNYSNPGTIDRPSLAAIPSGQDGTSLTSDDLIPLQNNLFNRNVGRDLLLDQEKQTAFLAFKQELGERTELFGEFAYGRRDFFRNSGSSNVTLTVPNTHPFFVSPDPLSTTVRIRYNMLADFGPNTTSGERTTYVGVLGGTADFGEDWQAEIDISQGREKNSSLNLRILRGGRFREALGFDDPTTPFDPAVDGYFNVFADGSNTPQNVLDYLRGDSASETDIDSKITTVRGKIDGKLFDAPGGAVKLAFGGESRKETFDRTDFITRSGVRSLSTTPISGLERQVYAMYSEILLPFFGESNRRKGFNSLEVSAAIRYEDYDDFGSSTDPKVGIAWSPTERFVLRGSWGTSFKAPLLRDLAPAGQQFIPIPLPSPTGSVQSFLLAGSNPDLEAETSTAWTLGIEIRPISFSGLSFELTYFDIDFEDRIGTLPGNITALFNTELWGPLIDDDPDDAVVQALIDSPYLNDLGFGVPAAADVLAIVDSRQRNLASTNISGLDFTIAYDAETSIGDLGFSLYGSYLFKFDQTAIVMTPTIELLNTVGQPVDLKLRGRASWSRGSYGATVLINYMDGYTDNLSDPIRPIDSWTTVDLDLRYDVVGDDQGRLGGTVISLNVRNLFDEDPPFVNNLGGFGYDPANASPLGRFISVNLTKKW